MKLDEIEKMAQQTAAYGVHPSGEFIYSFYTEQLQAFAKLVAEHERKWVGLTDKEIDEGLFRTNYAMHTAGAWRDGVEWAINQLREKNNE